MDIFKNNKCVNKFDSLDQAIILFSFQNKHISGLNENDCNIIVDLLNELKKLRKKSYDVDKVVEELENNTHIYFNKNTNELVPLEEVIEIVKAGVSYDD